MAALRKSLADVPHLGDGMVMDTMVFHSAPRPDPRYALPDEVVRDLRAAGVMVVDVGRVRGGVDHALKDAVVHKLRERADGLPLEAIAVITGDGDFVSTLRGIREEGCTTVLVAGPWPRRELVEAAHIKLRWNDVLEAAHVVPVPPVPWPGPVPPVPWPGPVPPVPWPTPKPPQTVCIYFSTFGACRFGERCAFLHERARPSPPPAVFPPPAAAPPSAVAGDGEGARAESAPQTVPDSDGKAAAAKPATVASEFTQLVTGWHGAPAAGHEGAHDSGVVAVAAAAAAAVEAAASAAAVAKLAARSAGSAPGSVAAAVADAVDAREWEADCWDDAATVSGASAAGDQPRLLSRVIGVLARDPVSMRLDLLAHTLAEVTTQMAAGAAGSNDAAAELRPLLRAVAAGEVAGMTEARGAPALVHLADLEAVHGEEGAMVDATRALLGAVRDNTSEGADTPLVPSLVARGQRIAAAAIDASQLAWHVASTGTTAAAGAAGGHRLSLRLPAATQCRLLAAAVDDERGAAHLLLATPSEVVGGGGGGGAAGATLDAGSTVPPHVDVLLVTYTLPAAFSSAPLPPTSTVCITPLLPSGATSQVLAEGMSGQVVVVRDLLFVATSLPSGVRGAATMYVVALPAVRPDAAAAVPLTLAGADSGTATAPCLCLTSATALPKVAAAVERAVASGASGRAALLPALLPGGGTVGLAVLAEGSAAAHEAVEVVMQVDGSANGGGVTLRVAAHRSVTVAAPSPAALVLAAPGAASLAAGAPQLMTDSAGAASWLSLPMGTSALHFPLGAGTPLVAVGRDGGMWVPGHDGWAAVVHARNEAVPPGSTAALRAAGGASRAAISDSDASAVGVPGLTPVVDDAADGMVGALGGGRGVGVVGVGAGVVRVDADGGAALVAPIGALLPGDDTTALYGEPYYIAAGAAVDASATAVAMLTDGNGPSGTLLVDAPDGRTFAPVTLEPGTIASDSRRDAPKPASAPEPPRGDDARARFEAVVAALRAAHLPAVLAPAAMEASPPGDVAKAVAWARAHAADRGELAVPGDDRIKRSVLTIAGPDGGGGSGADDLEIKMGGRFPSIALRLDSAREHLTTGRWYMEWVVVESRAPQVGWVDALYKSECGSGKGVGDDRHSWAADPIRGSLWHGGSNLPFETARNGAVVCAAVDVDAGNAWFAVNGAWDGSVAFQGASFDGGLMPACSAISGDRIRALLGDHDHPFRYGPPPGFRPLWHAVGTIHWAGNRKPVPVIPTLSPPPRRGQLAGGRRAAVNTRELLDVAVTEGLPIPLVASAARQPTKAAAVAWLRAAAAAHPPAPRRAPGEVCLTPAAFTTRCGSVHIDDSLKLSFTSTCGTAVANMPPLTAGRWYYEVYVADGRVPAYAVGVVDGLAAVHDDVERMVGCDSHGWAFNGVIPESVALHGNVARPFGERCYDRSTVRVALDVEAGALFYAKSASWTAASFGLAFDNMAIDASGVIPAFSGVRSTDLLVRVGDADHGFEFDPPPGYRPLWEAFPAAHFRGNRKPDGLPAPNAVPPPALRVRGPVADTAPRLPHGVTPVAVWRGPSHGLLVTAEGQALTWSGGTGSAHLLELPVHLDGTARRVVAGAVGSQHSMVLTSRGEVWAWGNNSAGQCGYDGHGDGTVAHPTRVAFGGGTPRMVAVAAAGDFSAAVDEVGGAWAWGAYPGAPASRATGAAPVCVTASMWPRPAVPFARVAAAPGILAFLPVPTCLPALHPSVAAVAPGALVVSGALLAAVTLAPMLTNAAAAALFANAPLAAVLTDAGAAALLAIVAFAAMCTDAGPATLPAAIALTTMLTDAAAVALVAVVPSATMLTTTRLRCGRCTGSLA